MSPQAECPVEPRSNRLPGRRNDLPDGVFDAVGNESFRQRRHGFGGPGRDARPVIAGEGLVRLSDKLAVTIG